MTEREWNAIERMDGLEFIIPFQSQFCGRYRFEVDENEAIVRWNQETWNSKLSDVYLTLTKNRNLGDYDRRFLREAYDIVYDPNFEP